VLSLLLVFRTNGACDRWWESRKLWCALVNNSRNMAMKLSAYLSDDDRTTRKQVAALIPFFAHALKRHLRDGRACFALDQADQPELASINEQQHVLNRVAARIAKKVNGLHQSGKIGGHQLLALNHEQMSFADICGACERIKNTPIPYFYSSFLEKFIFLYVLTMPLGLVFSLGYFVIPAVVFVFYVLASLELLAEEIEDPFDGDDIDLLNDKITDGITRHVNEIKYRSCCSESPNRPRRSGTACRPSPSSTSPAVRRSRRSDPYRGRLTPSWR